MVEQRVALPQAQLTGLYGEQPLALRDLPAVV